MATVVDIGKHMKAFVCVSTRII